MKKKSWKFLGGGGCSKTLRNKIPGGWGVFKDPQEQNSRGVGGLKPSVGGGMDIFWNHRITKMLKKLHIHITKLSKKVVYFAENFTKKNDKNNSFKHQNSTEIMGSGHGDYRCVVFTTSPLKLCQEPIILLPNYLMF